MQPDPPAWLVPVIVVGFFVAFAVIWSGVCALLALTSGWRAMAARYPLPEGLRGQGLASGWSIRVGLARYNGVLHFEATPQGLVARVMRLFPFHAPLLLPWSALELRRGGALFYAGEMRVAGGATFTLNGDAMASIERAHAAALHGTSTPTARA